MSKCNSFDEIREIITIVVNTNDIDTLLQHVGEEQHVMGAVVPPIFQNSLFVQDSCDAWMQANDPASQKCGKYVYSRVGNPNLSVVEAKISALEGCESTRCFQSGMGAMTAAIFSCLKAGDHAICIDTVYGPTRKFFAEFMARYGVETTFVDGRSVDNFVAAAQPNTKLIYLESPSSLVFQLQDLEAISEFARSRGIKTAIDATYNAGVFMNPHALGVDLVCHTASKYFGGHSDLVGGSLSGNAEDMNSILTMEYELLGAAMAPFTAWLVMRGMRTLAIRLQRHEETANIVAEWVHEQPKVCQMLCVGHESHEQHALFERTMRGSGGLFSFVPKTQDVCKIKAFVDSLQLFKRGVSWGGFESLCVPVEVECAQFPQKTWIIRLYCGLESPSAIIADLEQAFSHL